MFLDTPNKRKALSYCKEMGKYGLDETRQNCSSAVVVNSFRREHVFLYFVHNPPLVKHRSKNHPQFLISYKAVFILGYSPKCLRIFFLSFFRVGGVGGGGGGRSSNLFFLLFL